MLLPWDEEALPRWTTSPAADDHSLRWYNLVAADDDHTCGSSLLSCTRNNINNGRREDDPCFVSHDSDECDNHDHEEADSLFSRVCEDRASFFRLFAILKLEFLQTHLINKADAATALALSS